MVADWQSSGAKLGVLSGDSARARYKHAKDNDYAIPSFRCTGRDACDHVLQAGKQLNRPIAIYVSDGNFPNDQSKLQALIRCGNHVRQAALDYGIPVVLSEFFARDPLSWFEGALRADEAYFHKHGEPKFSSHTLDFCGRFDPDSIAVCRKYLARMKAVGLMMDVTIGCTDKSKGDELHKRCSAMDDVFAVYDLLSPLPAELCPKFVGDPQQYAKGKANVNWPVIFAFLRIRAAPTVPSKGGQTSAALCPQAKRAVFTVKSHPDHWPNLGDSARWKISKKARKEKADPRPSSSQCSSTTGDTAAIQAKRAVFTVKGHPDHWPSLGDSARWKISKKARKAKYTTRAERRSLKVEEDGMLAPESEDCAERECQQKGAKRERMKTSAKRKSRSQSPAMSAEVSVGEDDELKATYTTRARRLCLKVEEGGMLAPDSEDSAKRECQQKGAKRERMKTSAKRKRRSQRFAMSAEDSVGEDDELKEYRDEYYYVPLATKKSKSKKTGANEYRGECYYVPLATKTSKSKKTGANEDRGEYYYVPLATKKSKSNYTGAKEEASLVIAALMTLLKVAFSVPLDALHSLWITRFFQIFLVWSWLTAPPRRFPRRRTLPCRRVRGRRFAGVRRRGRAPRTTCRCETAMRLLAALASAVAGGLRAIAWRLELRSRWAVRADECCPTQPEAALPIDDDDKGSVAAAASEVCEVLVKTGYGGYGYVAIQRGTSPRAAHAILATACGFATGDAKVMVRSLPLFAFADIPWEEFRDGGIAVTGRLPGGMQGAAGTTQGPGSSSDSQNGSPGGAGSDDGERFSFPIATQATNDDGATPLVAAAQFGHDVCLKQLLEVRVDPEKATEDGWTPLSVAAYGGHDVCLKQLLEVRADPEKAHNDGRTPIWQAAQNGHDVCVQKLLQFRADPDKAHNDGRTPIWQAAQNGHDKCVQKLLQFRADPDKARNDDVATPLVMAAQFGHEVCLKQLLEARADPEKATNDGCTPLYLAAQNGHDLCLKRLLEVRADPEKVAGKVPAKLRAKVGATRTEVSCDSEGPTDGRESRHSCGLHQPTPRPPPASCAGGFRRQVHAPMPPQDDAAANTPWPPPSATEADGARPVQQLAREAAPNTIEAKASASGAVAVAEAVPGATAVDCAAASSSGAAASAEDKPARPSDTSDDTTPPPSRGAGLMPPPPPPDYKRSETCMSRPAQKAGDQEVSGEPGGTQTGRLPRKPASEKAPKKVSAATSRAPGEKKKPKADTRTKWAFQEREGYTITIDARNTVKPEEVDTKEEGVAMVRAEPEKYFGCYWLNPPFKGKTKVYPRECLFFGTGFGPPPSQQEAYGALKAQYLALPPLHKCNFKPDRYTDNILLDYAGKKLSAKCPGRQEGLCDVGELKLFGDVDPSDIRQGMVGDCWLLSAISALAEFDGSIQKLFTGCGDLDRLPADEFNVYTVRLWDLKTWTRVDIEVDERLVWFDDVNDVLGCKPTLDNELWPCLLEKAVAAHCGGWDKINGGQSTHAWRIMLGCKDVYTIKPGPDGKFVCYGAYNPDEKLENCPHEGCQSVWPMKWPECGGGGDIKQGFDEEQLFEKICAWDDQNYIMCAGTENGSDSHKTDGIVDGHAYTVIQCIDRAGGTDWDMLKVRNPWGEQEFDAGGWSDDGPMWDKFPGVKAACIPVAANDGIFWMCRQDFFKYFKTIYLCASDIKAWRETED